MGIGIAQAGEAKFESWHNNKCPLWNACVMCVNDYQSTVVYESYNEYLNSVILWLL